MSVSAKLSGLALSMAVATGALAQNTEPAVQKEPESKALKSWQASSRYEACQSPFPTVTEACRHEAIMNHVITLGDDARSTMTEAQKVAALRAASSVMKPNPEVERTLTSPEKIVAPTPVPSPSR